MTEPSQMQLHPLAALSVASRQNDFDKSEKLILASDICVLKDMLAQRDARIKELEGILYGADKDPDGGDDPSMLEEGGE